MDTALAIVAAMATMMAMGVPTMGEWALATEADMAVERWGVEGWAEGGWVRAEGCPITCAFPNSLETGIVPNVEI